jgi:hypothetical protein
VKTVFIFWMSLCLALCGCAGKSKKQAKVRHAYLAGEQAAMMQMQQQMQQPANPQVRILGAKNPVLIWSEGLTLAHALVDSEYESATTPTAIMIFRSGRELQIDPQRLLDGEDYPIFPGDIVWIQN